jgi:hypothetical protein
MEVAVVAEEEAARQAVAAAVQRMRLAQMRRPAPA